MPTFLPLRNFGKTSLRVTPLCVGAAELGSMPDSFAYEVEEDRALATLRAFFQSPLNFLDTSACYGESERRIGLALKDLGGLPAGFILATKADRDLKTGDFSGDQIKRSVNRSLTLLGLDKIQIMYLHDPEHAPFEDIMAKGGAVDVLVRLKEQGVIQHLGMAGGPVDLMIRYIETGAFEAVITHNRFTLLNRSADPLLNRAAQMGIAVLNAAPYGSGLLAKGPEAYPRYAYQAADALTLERVRKMDALCAKYKIPLAAAALQFSTHDPRITSTIVGMSRPERLAQTIDLAHTPIPSELWPALDAVGFATERSRGKSLEIIKSETQISALSDFVTYTRLTPGRSCVFVESGLGSIGTGGIAMAEERKKVLVDPFQARLTFRIAGYLVVFLVVFTNFLFAWKMWEEGPVAPWAQFLETLQANVPVFVLLLVLVPVMAWDSIRFSHRLVGPLVRFRQAMRELAAGAQVRPIKLRDGDYLVEMRDEFNAMLDELQKRGVPVLKPIDPARDQDATKKTA